MPPRDTNKPKTTLYHSELVKMGPVRVTVESDVLDSKFKKGEKYVMLTIDGAKRTYTLDSEACENFFDQQKGNTFTMQALGSKGEEDCEYLGEEEPEPKQAKAPPPRNPPPRQNAPPPNRPAPAGNKPAAAPPKPVADAKRNLLLAKSYIARCAALQRITLKATIKLNDEWKASTGKDLPLEMFQGINTSLFISAEHAMVKPRVEQAFYADAMPWELDFETLQPPVKTPAPKGKSPPKGKAKQEPPPEDQPAEDTAGQDPPPPAEDDDVPF